MIRFKEKEFEQWSICPATGDIFDVKTGEIQPVKIYKKYLAFKKMHVHRIMAHTFFGYKPGLVVHHKDENKLNNSLSNLVYMTISEHMILHTRGVPKTLEHVKHQADSTRGRHNSEEAKARMSASMKGRIPWTKGKHLSEEAKAKISAANKGKYHSEEAKARMSASMKGRHWWNNGKIIIRSKECPGEDWIIGRRILNG